MCVSLMCQWGIDLERFKVAISIVEYALIKYWAFLYEESLFEKEMYIDWLFRFCHLYEKCNDLFCKEIEEISQIEYGVPVYNPLEHKILLFDILGRLCVYGLYLLSNNHMEKGHKVTNTVISLLNNNPTYKYPIYDNQIMELSLLFLLLKMGNRDKDLATIVNMVASGIEVNFEYNHKYPAPNDFYDEAIQIELGEQSIEYKASVLFGGLLEWLCFINQMERYDELKRFIKDRFPDMTCQTWQIKESEEGEYYSQDALYKIGKSIPFDTKGSIDDFRKALMEFDKMLDFNSFSFNRYSFPAISFITSRYFHFPVLPQFWRQNYDRKELTG